MRRGSGLTIGLPLAAAAAASAPRARRLRSLENNVARALAEDQALLVDGILAAYEALASPGTLTRLEDQRYFALDADMAAPPMRGGARNHDDDAHRRTNGHGASPGLHALRLLNEVDVAIAWCEGKSAVTARLFPPGVLLQRTQRGRALSSEGSGRAVPKGMPLSSEPISSSWQEVQETEHYDALQEYCDNRDPNIESRSLAWPNDRRLSSPSYVAPRGVPEDVYTSLPSLPLPPAAAVAAETTTTTGTVVQSSLISTVRGSQGDSVVCNMGFDRWTARQVAAQAHIDQKRLWLLRCDAEETVRRYALAVEERVGRVTLLVTAREEIAAGLDAETRAQTVEPPMLYEKDPSEARVWMQRRLHAQEILLTPVVSAVKKGEGEYEAACQAQLQEAATCLLQNGEKTMTGASSPVKETRMPLSGACTAEVGWASFTYSLLREAEQSQRVHLEREAHLSWKLLLAQWQTVLNHVNARCLLAAKEGLIHAMAAGINGSASTQPKSSAL
ncbi:hypothetical protein TraAM80_04569 [Trypanosoma rangeli]|uniref:Uncharacterized protein n=1 Tax=Trypanosoma rangeli TaxID=5698 RepID=A0A422NIS5_TRYRA|nr:uncharacterized protein TraAM80_04569 [Trypanosoma rangeli]RNF05370.1 hypothetical protein TraAM80_04569 [Trypanosoma rangeli]|eukprot:RNF05370.1 hypothetical protein TraAM80_04569 [Trypanosoma rangeli]